MLLPHNSMIHLFVLFCPDKKNYFHWKFSLSIDRNHLFSFCKYKTGDVIKAAPAVQKVTSVKSEKNGIRIRWKPQKKCDGYYIYRNHCQNKAQYHCYYCSKPSLHNLFPSFPIFFLQQMNFYICCMYFHMAL